MSTKPLLCLDFDGVLHSYSSGWQGADVVQDPPVDGAMEFLDRAVAQFRVAIYSSRSSTHLGRMAMQHWLKLSLYRWAGSDVVLADEIFSAIEWPTSKPAAMVTLDDRAITFNGTWPAIETLQAFQPWNRRSAAEGTSHDA